MRRVFVTLCVALAPAIACNLGTVCTADVKPAIRVTVVEAATMMPIKGDARIVATDGAYADTMNLPPFVAGVRVAYLAAERPGIYRVEVEAPGYSPWIVSGVRVKAGECHVQTVDLTVELDSSGAE